MPYIKEPSIKDKLNKAVDIPIPKTWRIATIQRIYTKSCNQTHTRICLPVELYLEDFYAKCTKR